MWQFMLGTWAVAGVLTAGVLTGVVQNPPAALDRESQDERPMTGGAESQAAEPRGVTEDRDDLGVQFRMSNSGQLMISSLGQRSAAAASGLREGDIIVSVGGRTFASEPALREFLIRLSKDDRIPVVVMRAGRQQTALWAFNQEQPFKVDERENRADGQAISRGEPRGRVREHRTARPDFDLAERIERMEAEIEALRGEVQELRERLNAVAGRQSGHEPDARPELSQPNQGVDQGLLEPSGEPDAPRDSAPEREDAAAVHRGSHQAIRDR